MNGKTTTIYQATILIAAYNYGQYIRDTLQSIKEYINDDKYQVIIIDDCSTDETETIIKTEFNNQIEYHKNENNLGKSLCTKMGIKMAAGKYFFVLDADDLYMPGKIEKSIEIFEKYANVTLINHNYLEIDPYGDEIGSKIYSLDEGIQPGQKYVRKFLSGKIKEPIGFGSIFCARTEFLKNIEPSIDESFKQSIDSYLQIAAISNGDIYHINEYLFKYRIHSNSLYQSRAPLEKMKLLLKALQNISTIEKIKENPKQIKILLYRIQLLESTIRLSGFLKFFNDYLSYLIARKSFTFKPAMQYFFRRIGKI